MADLFIKQAEQYSVGRPSYPKILFDFIASKTPSRDLAWDVGTGSGQAARSLANIYKNVIATDTSPKQLEFADKFPNITYKHTSPCMTMSELQEKIGPKSSVDLVTIAQAMHWFDLPKFYQQVKWVLKKPDGVIAAWCYTTPEVNPGVDSVLQRYYTDGAGPYWDPARKFVEEKYETIDFPFEPVDGLENNGPFRFDSEKVMDLEGYLTYLKSWSAYQTAKEKGVELLTDDVVEGFTRAWNEDGKIEKVVIFPVYLRIGKIGS
ncbi:S-adenosyl-L-methionine-dependent methyltransferases superfamily protein [Striga hermonthica]|uniref:S-adenosyl-L-methionine-dependent methyltransferases superfamily protein n=1 Tax=Striga hermonthica TaxID=68872 RepID=A0A9N7NG14_STRHE|nr:S-adenosyl-L-methionine-dependent methyltransferases superfamily protein [Striga hermonthica]